MLKPLPVDRSAADANISVITFILHTSFTTHELAHMLDSLVRVSRRVDRNHFSIAQLTSMISEHIHTLEVSYHVPRSITPKSRKMPTWQEAQHNLAKG